ncbi:hypothetical protein, partial [Rhodosalinus sp.]|uniref:hypothetical protein n=1 Tax=Rhodosalinus sp. TaxID=2047741 RepID=UPI003563EBC8
KEWRTPPGNRGPGVQSVRRRPWRRSGNVAPSRTNDKDDGENEAVAEQAVVAFVARTVKPVPDCPANRWRKDDGDPASS